MSDLYPDQEALVGSGQRFTYHELKIRPRIVWRTICCVRASGKATEYLLQLPNGPEFVISYYALQKAGLVIVLLTVNHTAREVSHLANLTQPTGWILPSAYRKIDFLPQVRTVQEQNPGLDKIIFVGHPPGNSSLTYDGLLDTDASDEAIASALEASRPDPMDVCQILPSGGTTGLPKGAPRTHNDYLCNVEYKSRAWHINVTDTCLVATTVGHNLALLVCVTGPMFHGAKIVMLDSTYPQDFCATIQAERVTCAGLVPTLVSRLASFDGLQNYDLSSFKKMYVGAANSPQELVREVEKKLGCLYINAFGMVEGPCAQTRPDSPFEMRCSTIGRPVCPYDEMVTLDADGNPTAPGVEGELAAKGPGIFTGYYDNPQANRASFTKDGYFRTGDLAVIDEHDVIRITGRIKDIIIRGGENIAAQEVEELISSYPPVQYVSVVGMPHPDLGEEVCAYIQPIPGFPIKSDEIAKHLSELGASKILVPARIEFVEQLPLTAAGKVDKKALRADIARKLSTGATGA